MKDDKVSQDIRIKKYILRHNGLIIIPRILREANSNWKPNPRPKVEQMKRVMLEMVTEEYSPYVEGTVTGFIKKFPLDVEKLAGLIAAGEYKQNCQRPNGRVSNCQRQIFEEQLPTIKDWRNSLN